MHNCVAAHSPMDPGLSHTDDALHRPSPVTETVLRLHKDKDRRDTGSEGPVEWLKRTPAGEGQRAHTSPR